MSYGDNRANEKEVDTRKLQMLTSALSESTDITFRLNYTSIDIMQLSELAHQISEQFDVLYEQMKG